MVEELSSLVIDYQSQLKSMDKKLAKVIEDKHVLKLIDERVTISFVNKLYKKGK